MGERPKNQGRDVFKRKPRDADEVKADQAMAEVNQAADADRDRIINILDQEGSNEQPTPADLMPRSAEVDSEQANIVIPDYEKTEKIDEHGAQVEDKTQVSVLKTLKDTEIQDDEVLLDKTQSEATVAKAPDFQAAGQAFAKEAGEDTQVVTPEGISGLEAYNSDEIPESELPALGQGVVAKEKAVEVSSTDASGTGSAEIDPLTAEHAAAEAAVHSTVDDRMALTGVEKLMARMKKTAPEISQRVYDTSVKDQINEGLDALKDQKEFAADVSEAENEVKLEEAAKEADIDALQEMAAAAQAMRDNRKSSMDQNLAARGIEAKGPEAVVEAVQDQKAEAERVKEEKRNAIRNKETLRGGEPLPSQKAIDNVDRIISRIQSERVTAADVRKQQAEDEVVARNAEEAVAEETRERKYKESEAAREKNYKEAQAEAEAQAEIDRERLGGFENAEQQARAQIVGEQIKALKAEKEGMTKEEFKAVREDWRARRDALLDEVHELTGFVRETKSDLAPAEVKEPVVEAPEQKFEKFKKGAEVELPMSKGLRDAINAVYKNKPNEMPASLKSMVNGGMVELQSLGVGTDKSGNTVYEFILPGVSSEKNTSANTIRISEADLGGIIEGPAPFLKTEQVPGQLSISDDEYDKIKVEPGKARSLKEAA